ncbi:hypothetical protein [Pedobacter zeae]|uniref:Uncharacterized protein n=1 Tax=Pedobacter zeae TaxID=1737356 RepID=A0A7W6P692_9SPHI|nr:hypothetical protein [Pedobacter zeae]MBB4107694.1 hypothetical protein [Pedobacter zeae]GGG97661.1 hypothetical protein GCM10007422_09580 [Pedobacter zeae]
MSTIQIEKGIPAPIKHNWKAELGVMEAGESALIDNEFANSVKAAISQHFHKEANGKEFQTGKAIDDLGNEIKGKFRVWCHK